MRSADIEQAIRNEAPDIARRIRDAAADNPGNEPNFRRPVERALEDFGAKVGVSVHADHECTLCTGRADSVYNRFVVEYEPPGSLRKANTHGANRHSIGQVKDYIEGLQRRQRQRRERIAGVVLDGHWLIFVRYKDGRWEIDDPVPVADESTGRFLRYLSSLSTEQAVTPDNLVRDFGENTRIAKGCVSRLHEALTTTQNPRVEALFEQWSLQFSEICGYEPESTRLDVQALASSFGVDPTHAEPFKLLFALHTYCATFIKLLAIQVASFYAMPRLGTGLQQVANYDERRLRDYLADAEKGGVFRHFGIMNFLEGDFFGWYLDVWDAPIDKAVRPMIAQLAGYSLVSLDVDPDSTRDLLKRLYQNLMPKALRHDLGEYYTPDWLAEHVLERIGYTPRARGLDGRRILDPACGSGTFLVQAIKRVRLWAGRRNPPPAEADLLGAILANVVGFDLNPLAVIAARTNYLLALGDLLQHRRGDIYIPVYLADSILTPSVAMVDREQMVLGETSEQALAFSTSVGRFAVPKAVVSDQQINALANLLEECLSAQYSTDDFGRRFRAEMGLDGPNAEGTAQIACELYDRLMDLEGRGIDGVWARIIKNAFAPVFCGRFDYVAGNPPWVNWANLPDAYRQQTAPLWARYELFAHKGLRAKLGGAMDDISILMLYAAVDSYLLPRGKLGFVITQTVFKTEGGGAGFRRFQLGFGTHMCVLHVDDMTELQPFEGATNRTATVVVRKGSRTSYPVPWTTWRKAAKRTPLPMDATVTEVRERTTRRIWVAAPVDPSQPSSPWVTGKHKAVDAARKALGHSPYRGRKGISTSANGVYWVSVTARRPDGDLVVANIPQAGRKRVEPRQAALEAELVYPLVRGRDVTRWCWRASHSILVPYLPDDPTHAVAEAVMRLKYPKVYRYLRSFREMLCARPQYTSLAAEGEPFYALYNIGPYTFCRHRVVWRELAATLTAAVIGEWQARLAMPDHKLVTVACASDAEAHFVCAILNSAVAQYLVASYTVEVQVGPHILDRLGVPCFDDQTEHHSRLAALSVEAHGAARDGDRDCLCRAEAGIDELVAQLWGVTKAELKDIQDSLAELHG